MNNPLNELSAVYNQNIAEGCGCDKKEKKDEMLPQGKTPEGGDGARGGKNKKGYVEPMGEEYKDLPKRKMGMKAGKKTLSALGHALKTGTDGVGSIEDQKRGQQANKKAKQADKIHGVAKSHSPELSKMKSIKNRLTGMTEEEETGKIGGGNLKKLATKATKRVDADVDGDVDTDDMKSSEMGEYLPSPDGKKKVKTKARFESYSSWRTDLREIVGNPADAQNVEQPSPKKDTEAQKEIKEKNIKNKIKINPPQGVTEGFEELGGVVIEMYELDEASYEAAAAEVNKRREAEKAAKDKRMTITPADKKGNTPAYQNYMKGDKRYKMVGEKLDMKKADMGEVIKDFRKSDAPQFKGKSDKKIQKMAIAAKLEADRGMKEETEEEKKKRDLQAKTKEHDDKMAGKLAEQSGGGLAKLGPRESGKRKDKGKSKPQAIRQSKARLAALKKKLNVEETGAEYHARMKKKVMPWEKPNTTKSNTTPEVKAKMAAMSSKKTAPKKDTRTSAQKMTDATGPRPGSNYRGD